ncbi:hypothetical protein GmHk_06G017117 [Glycine max]|nr:hypothetical protein GmHk_06G017117 [Glycine max]
MVDQFAELGVRNKKLNQFIAKSPQLLLRKPKDFLQIVLLFENMGFDKETIGTILARCPEIFAASINKTLQRKIELLIFYWVFLKLSFLGLSESIQNYVFLTLTKLCYKGIVLTHLFYILLTIAPVSYLLLFPNQWLN